MIVHNFVGIFWVNTMDHIVKNIIKKDHKFYITRTMKNIACVHCNLNKIIHKEVSIWPTQNNLKKNMTFKVDNHLKMEGVVTS